MKKVKFLGYTCKIERLKYPNKRIALELTEIKTGDSVCTASVNIPEAPCGPNQCFIKDWSENEGIAKVLEDAGIIKPTGISVETGFVVAKLYDIIG